jgi:NAD(P)-dependent dehydrogenase (short-subunit alcohol dehydrogenase family)
LIKAAIKKIFVMLALEILFPRVAAEPGSLLQSRDKALANGVFFGARISLTGGSWQVTVEHESDKFDAVVINGSSGALRGRVVMITGASSGLGAHLSKVVARQGARVVLAARRTELLADLVNELEMSGGQALAVAMDVAVEISVTAAYERAVSRFGTVDTVIACAGIAPSATAIDQTASDFVDALRINVVGAFLTLREGARRLIDAGSPERGRFVILSSVSAQHVIPGLVAYSASKAAVIQMGKVMAREWARLGLCVNSVLPGYVRTDLNAHWFDSAGGSRQVASWPRRRLMHASDLDGIILFLCSDAAGGTTGGLFTIDDGQTL